MSTDFSRVYTKRVAERMTGPVCIACGRRRGVKGYLLKVYSKDGQKSFWIHGNHRMSTLAKAGFQFEIVPLDVLTAALDVL